MKQAFEQILRNAALNHFGAFAWIAAGVYVILYSSFAKRMSFEGDFPGPPEEIVKYKPTRNMRLYGISIGSLVLLYGLYGIFFAEPAGVQFLHSAGAQSLRSFLAHFVTPHRAALSYALAGIGTVLWVSFGKRINREFFKTASKGRIYVLCLGVFLLCCSIYACIKRH